MAGLSISLSFSYGKIFVMITSILQQKPEYKVLFIVLGFCFNTAMLIPELRYVFDRSFFIHTTMVKLQVSHFLFVLTNLAASATFLRRQMINFLVQANNIGLVFSFLMLPLCLFNFLLNVVPIINDGLMIIIFLAMIVEYKRLMQAIGLHNNHKIVITDAIASVAFITYLVLG